MQHLWEIMANWRHLEKFMEKAKIHSFCKFCDFRLAINITLQQSQRPQKEKPSQTHTQLFSQLQITTWCSIWNPIYMTMVQQKMPTSRVVGSCQRTTLTPEWAIARSQWRAEMSIHHRLGSRVKVVHKYHCCQCTNKHYRGHKKVRQCLQSVIININVICRPLLIPTYVLAVHTPFSDDTVGPVTRMASCL